MVAATYILRLHDLLVRVAAVYIIKFAVHGERTPDKSHLYPNDPYLNYDFLPIGYGQLTNKGKLDSYMLGQFLRNRYGEFLGDVYWPGLLDPWSSNYDRTKVVLQLVLAALFPPKTDQMWHDQQKWQPIPFRYVDGKSERVFLSVVNCPKAVAAVRAFVECTEGQAMLAPHKDLLTYLTEQTGWNMFSTRKMLYLAVTLMAEDTMGFKLPKWTENVWPKPIEDIASLDYVAVTANTHLKSRNVGLLIQKIVDDTKLKIAGQSDCKMHLYSGHDVTVAMVMRCLNIYYAHVPKYSACLILELHRIDGVYGFKIFYKESGADEPKLFRIPGCPEFCPLDQFLANIQDVLDENQRIYSPDDALRDGCIKF